MYLFTPKIEKDTSNVSGYELIDVVEDTENGYAFVMAAGKGSYLQILGEDERATIYFSLCGKPDAKKVIEEGISVGAIDISVIPVYE